MSKKEVSVIGAGLVGSLLSIYLAKRGFKVNVFERRPDMRKEKVAAGRSINLALSDRGWKALEQIGIGDEIKKISIPMKGRMIHDLNGSLKFLPYGKSDQAIYSVSRGTLNSKLMELAEKNGCQLFFNERCSGLNLKKKSFELEHADGTKRSVQSEQIFGADGAFSAARLQVQLSTDRFNYSQYYIPHGYKELTIPPAKDGTWQLDKNALHIWPRGQFMLIALPNLDGSFTCTLFFPFDGDPSFSSLKSEAQISAFFNEVFPDTVALMPTLIHDFMHNPVSSLVTVKCFPWTIDDFLLLIGDAAHAIVPFFGQGMNAGFEDCTVLNELMEKHGENWSLIFKEFELKRKPDGDAIAELALQNFIEMRDLVAKPDFILRKKIENRFSEKYPDKWLPLYSLVTFSPQVRYSQALSVGHQQEKIMDEVMSLKNIEKNWDSEEVEKKILSLL